MTLKNKREIERKQKMQNIQLAYRPKTNEREFSLASERGCKQRHLSMELSGTFRFDVI